jgi:hypothetical protein
VNLLSQTRTIVALFILTSSLVSCSKLSPPSWIIGEWEPVEENKICYHKAFKFNWFGAYSVNGSNTEYQKFTGNLMNLIFDESNDSTYVVYQRHLTESSYNRVCFKLLSKDTIMHIDSSYYDHYVTSLTFVRVNN